MKKIFKGRGTEESGLESKSLKQNRGGNGMNVDGAPGGGGDRY